MAAAWRRSWMSRVSSTERGRSRRLQTDGQPSRSYLGSSATPSSATTASSTRSHTSTSTPVGEPAAGPVFHPFIFLPKAPVVDEKAEELDEERAEESEEERAKARGLVKSHLVHEFCSDVCIGLDRWLSELHVGWVLHLADDDASSGSRGSILISRQLQHLAQSWILALLEINSYLSRCFNRWYSHSQELEETVCPPACDFARFVEATLSKMLPFVDTVVNLAIIHPSCSEHCVAAPSNGAAAAPAEKLQALIDVRDALSGASEKVQLWDLWFCSSSDVQVPRITGLLLAKLAKLDEAICNTRSCIRTRIMSLTYDDESLWATQTPQRSPDIHKVTRSAISYIDVLSTSYEASLRGKCVADFEIICHSTSLIREVFCSLEEKLVRESQTLFSDHSLRFLFLINNSYFMSQKLHTNRFLAVPMQALARKIDGYINSYLQASWTPVLKCLHSPTSLHCFRRHSPLPKFQSKFQKTYTAQKLWKVPDPKLRKRLRKAIVEKVIPAFTGFLEDNNIDTPGVTPENLEEMLEELFEG
ncbi:uncharacterized protein LOC133927425 [Phragmites australis]|uniref:uncharacterized protein LOC133927425 n=1 Tax=Phragmites australis TaxID=29695 RepID=UPI002D784528|nr:uncharacterized protein LOC133927425 [Phragmites australis]